MATSTSLSTVLKPQEVSPLKQNTVFSTVPSSARTFLKDQLEIESDEELERHVLIIQADAYKANQLTITTLPLYQHILKLGREREDPLFLELGCCFGVETRKVIADGFPANCVIATDIERGFWDLGHQLFRTDARSCPIHFIQGDLTSARFMPSDKPSAPPTSAFSTTPIVTDRGCKPRIPNLSALTSLAPLQGIISAIYIGAIFTLFSEPQQAQLARNLASLLSPTPGSVITGWNLGCREKGDPVPGYTSVFAHCPESWKAMWRGVLGEDACERVRIDVELIEDPGDSEGGSLLLVWGIIRL